MPKENTKQAVAEIRAAGVEVSISPEDLFGASLDHTRYSFMPDARVWVRNGEEIAFVLKTANELGVCVSVRGSGTGCAGGCVPVDGGIVLDLSKINFIEIYPAERTARVGAGAVTAEIDARAAEVGLMYAADPSSHKYSSIGGNISCNAGGLRAAKYGNTRENVLALTAYLADGRKLECGRPIKKFSVGPNLRDFFIGSEGTFGVVGEAWVKLLPRPRAKRAVIAFPKSDFGAFDAVEKLMRSPLTPSICEFMDADTLKCVRVKNPSIKIDAPESAAALLLEFDGEPLQTEEDAKSAEKLLSEYGARAARDGTEAERFWEVRRRASQSMYLLGDSKVNQDIVLPFSSVKKYFEFFKKLAHSSGLPAPVFGHSADGNYHIHFMYCAANVGDRQKAWDAMEQAVKKAIEMGGAVSGEHGIGFLKSKYMPFQHSEAELDTMRALKKLFDPKNILNPHKVYFPGAVKDIPPPLTGVKLPWD